ncbi:hypothetical protein ACH4D5_23410 [Streptomyces sp. NPDC018029]|uniref:hypothetical protein n=1 Tax=Streptomyces sp. NPDC018029 TaxID=3365032 RepID=UPI00379A41CE
MADEDHCGADGSAGPAPEGGTARESDAAPDEPRAECVLCREPTEYPESRKGVTLCPACEWQEAQRSACSG